MSKNKQLAPSVKYQILIKLKEGVSIKTLSRNHNITTGTIRKWDKMIGSRSLERQKGSGRKRKFNFEEMEKLEEIFDSNRDIGSRKLVPIIKMQMNTSLSDRLIRRYRKQNDWIWVRQKQFQKFQKIIRKKGRCIVNSTLNMAGKMLFLLMNHK